MNGTNNSNDGGNADTEEGKIVSELQEAYKEMESIRKTPSFKKVKHAVEQEILLMEKKKSEETKN